MKPQFITDEKGNRINVILSIEDYDKLLKEASKKDSSFAIKERFPLRGKPIYYEKPFAGISLDGSEDSQ